MSFLIMLLVLIAVLFIPVMIGARVVGAQNSGFGSAVIAVIALALIGAVCEKLIDNTLLNFLAAAGLGGLALSATLGTTFWRAIGVSLIATAIQVGAVLFIFGAAMAAT